MPMNWMPPLPSSKETIEALQRITAQLAEPEERQGQIEMACAVADAIDRDTNLVVQAGTGTGKSLAYLLPAVLAGKKTVVATATKALQDQLAMHDLPMLQRHLGHDFDFCVVKGRGNYVCVQQLQELTEGQITIDLADTKSGLGAEIEKIRKWSQSDEIGDLALIDFPISDAAKAAVSVGADECPGASKCASGGRCFAEFARARAEAADIVVVNTHLYGLDVATEGKVLPEHQLVIFDEAHTLEGTISDTVSVNIGPGRINQFAGSLRRLFMESPNDLKLANIAASLKLVLTPLLSERLSHPLPNSIAELLSELRIVVNDVITELKKIESENTDVVQRKLRAQTMAGHLATDIDVALAGFTGSVAFVEGKPDWPVLVISPLDVSGVLNQSLWSARSAILTSATIPATLPTTLGLPEDKTQMLSVESPFDYEKNALMYCAAHLPNPNDPSHAGHVVDELEQLILAAGGRTLALFTSYARLDHAVTELRQRLPFKILSQRDMSKMALVAEFEKSEETCLFATSGFFQGIDIPGRTLSLVTIDRIPFPSPKDPLLSARSDAHGADGFKLVYVPIATTYLAQAIGRLIRTRNDRGVVAVFDPRLTKANYAWSIVNGLPPMGRTRNRDEAENFLRAISAS